jgi:hypothetical protein
MRTIATNVTKLQSTDPLEADAESGWDETVHAFEMRIRCTNLHMHLHVVLPLR